MNVVVAFFSLTFFQCLLIAMTQKYQTYGSLGSPYFTVYFGYFGSFFIIALVLSYTEKCNKTVIRYLSRGLFLAAAFLLILSSQKSAWETIATIDNDFGGYKRELIYDAQELDFYKDIDEHDVLVDMTRLFDHHYFNEKIFYSFVMERAAEAYTEGDFCGWSPKKMH